MVKLVISRKKFLKTALSGIAGISLINRQLHGTEIKHQVLRSIGNTGIKVTPLCFGAPRTTEESLIKYALEKGINFIDTGRSYGNGNNEELVGRALKGVRENVVIQSKIHLYLNELPSEGKGKRGAKEIRDVLTEKIEVSLKALNTDYIDIMLYHEASDEKLVFHEETLKFFSEMKQTGKIRAHGFSAHNNNMNLIARNNKQRFYDIIMVPFNHKGSFVHSVTGKFSEWDQPGLVAILEEAWKNGTGIVVMKTCSGGKYSPSPDVEPSFKEAVKWVLQHEFISSAAVAMPNFEQVNEQSELLVEL